MQPQMISSVYVKNWEHYGENMEASDAEEI